MPARSCNKVIVRALLKKRNLNANDPGSYRTVQLLTWAFRQQWAIGVNAPALARLMSQTCFYTPTPSTLRCRPWRYRYTSRVVAYRLLQRYSGWLANSWHQADVWPYKLNSCSAGRFYNLLAAGVNVGCRSRNKFTVHVEP